MTPDRALFCFLHTIPVPATLIDLIPRSPVPATLVFHDFYYQRDIHGWVTPRKCGVHYLAFHGHGVLDPDRVEAIH
jgi:hypothetical protein